MTLGGGPIFSCICHRVSQREGRCLRIPFWASRDVEWPQSYDFCLFGKLVDLRLLIPYGKKFWREENLAGLAEFNLADAEKI